MDYKFDLQLFASTDLDFKGGVTADATVTGGSTMYISTDGKAYSTAAALTTAGGTQIGTVVVKADLAATKVSDTDIKELNLTSSAVVTLSAAADKFEADSVSYVSGTGITAFKNLKYSTAGVMASVFSGASGLITGKNGTYTLNSFSGGIDGSADDIKAITSGTITTGSDFNGKFMSTAVKKENTLGKTMDSNGADIFTIDAIGSGQDYDIKGAGQQWKVVGSSGADNFTVNGGVGNVTLDGGDGIDTFQLDAANKVSLVGGAGGDKVLLGAALLTGSEIFVGAGDDVVTVNSAAQLQSGILVDLGEGNDTLSAATNANGFGNNTTIIGGAGKDSIDFTAVTDAAIEMYIDGGADADIIKGTAAVTNSTVTGGDGNDTLGGFGETVTLEGAGGSDYFDVGTNATGKANVKDYTFGEDYLLLSASADAVGDVNKWAAGTAGGLTKDGAYGFIANDGTSGAATITSSAGFYAATLVDNKGAKVNLGWVGSTPVTLDASDQKVASVITGKTNTEADLLIGGTKADTIYAGAKDSVYGGAGSDEIKIAGNAGVYVGLSAEGGADTVTGFTKGWDIEKADAVSLMGGTADDLKIINNGAGKEVSLKSGSATMVLSGVGTADEANIIISDKKVDVIAKNAKATVTDDSTIADYYIGTEASAIDMSKYTGDVQVDLSTEMFRNITTLQAGAGNESVLGAKAAESLVGGAGATSLYGGAGVDTLVSGKGKTTFFANESSGKDIVTGFVVGTADTSDVINVNNLKSITRTDNTNFTVDLDGTNSLKVKQASGDINSNIQWVSGDASGVVKIGKSATDNKFSYDAATTNYYGSSKTDIVSVASGTADNFNVWLDQTGDMFISVEGYDFSQTSGNVLAAGKNGVAETIVAGKGNSSLWGGTGSTKDVLVNKNSSATAEFFYGMGDGNDEIQGQKGDSVNLYNLSVSDITKATINSNNVVFTTSANETVTVSGSVGTFKLADGSSWTADYSKKSWTQN